MTPAQRERWRAALADPRRWEVAPRDASAEDWAVVLGVVCHWSEQDRP